MAIPPLRPWLVLVATVFTVAAFAGAAPEFEVRFTDAVRPGPVSARVYVMLGPAKGEIKPGPRADPRFGPDWFHPQPFFAVDAHDWPPGAPLRVGADAVGFPTRLDALPPGDYSAQAVIRLNPDTHRIGDGEGNAFGPVSFFTIGPETGDRPPIPLTVDGVNPRRTFVETDRLRYVEIASPLLSAFHHRPITHRAAVILPEGVRESASERRAALYIIPGFGGDHFEAARMVDGKSSRTEFGADLVRVVLNPDCGTGHHVFADSATNGPRGRALVEELIPHIEKTYPVIASPRARLLTGHSSGGWASLWLQVTYLDEFGGVWSTSPDPVDFRDFQKIDLYAPGENMFRDPNGTRRPIAHRGPRPVLDYDRFSAMEDVIGPGGQLHSFEAVFSPLDPVDRRPRRLWDRATGAVDPEVARAWQKYDIRLVLERGWRMLGPKLQGKLHVVVGDLDTFYLDGAVVLLRSTLRDLESDAEVSILPGRDHSNVIDASLAARFDRQMKAATAKLKDD